MVRVVSETTREEANGISNVCGESVLIAAQQLLINECIKLKYTRDIFPENAQISEVIILEAFLSFLPILLLQI